MTRLVRLRIGDQGPEEDEVYVEVDGDPHGTELVSGGDRIEEAVGTLTERLSSVRRAVGATLDELGTALGPDVIRVTVGVKLSAETGAIIARSSAEGNLRVQMEWDRRDGTGG
ncbi:CU044_2847 family protein [Nocardiopsis coralli]|uniref:CU044_2847 family protein n=1 Tax=Nocardiopsis coralli TaxID=2772213 RepID=UPI002E2E4FE0|nr:CU044_2847 family protein [Nocardiopsis coralli]